MAPKRKNDAGPANQVPKRRRRLSAGSISYHGRGGPDANHPRRQTRAQAALGGGSPLLFLDDRSVPRVAPPEAPRPVPVPAVYAPEPSSESDIQNLIEDDEDEEDGERRRRSGAPSPKSPEDRKPKIQESIEHDEDEEDGDRRKRSGAPSPKSPEDRKPKPQDLIEHDDDEEDEERRRRSGSPSPEDRRPKTNDPQPCSRCKPTCGGTYGCINYSDESHSGSSSGSGSSSSPAPGNTPSSGSSSESPEVYGPNSSGVYVWRGSWAVSESDENPPNDRTGSSSQQPRDSVDSHNSRGSPRGHSPNPPVTPPPHPPSFFGVRTPGRVPASPDFSPNSLYAANLQNSPRITLTPSGFHSPYYGPPTSTSSPSSSRSPGSTSPTDSLDLDLGLSPLTGPDGIKHESHSSSGSEQIDYPDSDNTTATGAGEGDLAVDYRGLEEAQMDALLDRVVVKAEEEEEEEEKYDEDQEDGGSEDDDDVSGEDAGDELSE